MHDFTPYASAVGGLLIGLSASLLLFFNGRVAGISGIANGAVFPESKKELSWRVAFLAGLLVGGFALAFGMRESFGASPGRSLPMLALAGLVVGFGVRLGSGCTSGHGVCGLSRLSARSLVATVTFIGAGALTVVLLRLLGVAS
ncbi:MAG: YeeE/YedE family protein [Sandaracinaceae bacterium]